MFSLPNIGSVLGIAIGRRIIDTERDEIAATQFTVNREIEHGGDVFRVEVDGELKATRMEFRHFTGSLKGRELFGQAGEYYSTEGYHLKNGLRAAIGV